MGYMIEGGGSKTMSKAKHWLNTYPNESKQLLQLLTDVIVDYFEMQVKAGAQMLQVFESSADYISKEEFAAVSLPYVRQIRDRLHERLQSQNIDAVPMVIFAKGAGHSLKEQADLGYEVIGLDWTVDPIEARKTVGPSVTLQGNLNPEDMYKTPVGYFINGNNIFPVLNLNSWCCNFHLQEEIKQLVEEMTSKFGKHRYIANLGHGITPQTPIESMTVLVDTVHSA